MKSLINTILFASSFLFSVNATAVDYFVGVDAVHTNIKIDNIDYHPTLARLRIGAFFNRGIGLELNLADTMKADEEDDFSTTLESHYAAILRLQSPSDGGLSLYVNLGYGVAELLVESTDSALVLEEAIESPSASIGFQKQFVSNSKVSYFGEFGRIFQEDDITISGISFGYQYNF